MVLQVYLATTTILTAQFKPFNRRVVWDARDRTKQRLSWMDSNPAFEEVLAQAAKVFEEH